MNLRAQAELDLAMIIEDDAGFACSITIVDPTGTENNLKGQCIDISSLIDPETGQVISGRSVSVSLSQRTLRDKGLSMPKAVNSTQQKPWVVKVTDHFGDEHSFKVVDAYPDRTMGFITCILSTYEGI